MEDSFDSSYDFSKPKKKSPRGKDKRSNSNSNSNKDKYDFPAPINTRSVKSKNYSEDSNSGIDKDILFSPTGSEDFDSPIADKSKGKYKSKFDFDEPTVTATTKPTSDYLSNFANTSGDLEDSILGELLGGPKKTKIPTSSPVSATNKSNRPVQMKLDPIDQKSNKSNFSFGNSNSNSNSNNAPADSLTNNSFDDWDADDVLDVDIPMHTTKTVTDSAAPVVTETKKSNTISLQNPMAGKTTDLPKRKGSVDFDDMDDLLNDNLPNSNRNSSTMPSLMQPSRALDPLKRTNSFKAVVSDSPSPPALPRGNRRDFDDSIDVDDRTGPSTEPEKQEKSTKAADSYIPSVYNPSSLSTKSSTKKSDNDGDVGGFIPSFLEPGNRQGRRRRYRDSLFTLVTHIHAVYTRLACIFIFCGLILEIWMVE